MTTLYYKTDDDRYLPIEMENVPKAKENEFMLVRVGDPATGWVPEQKEVDEILKILEELVPQPRSPFFIYHFGINMEILSVPEGEAVLLAKVGDPVSGWWPTLEDLDFVEAELKKLFADHPNIKVKATYYDVEVSKPEPPTA